MITRTGITAEKFGGMAQDVFDRLRDKILLTTGVYNTAVGDSFKRMGLNSAAAVTALANQAQIDFARIRDSGLATADGVRDAFIKAFDESVIGIAFKNLGVQSQSVLRNLADNSIQFFNTVVTSGEAGAAAIATAYTKTIEAVRAAGGTQKEIFELSRLVGPAIKQSFDLGISSVDEYTKALFVAGDAVRTSLSVPVGNVQAAFATFGIKTRKELEAIAETSRKAFEIVQASGQLTADGAATAAAKYKADWIAAFGDISKAGKALFAEDWATGDLATTGNGVQTGPGNANRTGLLQNINIFTIDAGGNITRGQDSGQALERWIRDSFAPTYDQFLRRRG